MTIIDTSPNSPISGAVNLISLDVTGSISTTGIPPIVTVRDLSRILGIKFSPSRVIGVPTVPISGKMLVTLGRGL